MPRCCTQYCSTLSSEAAHVSAICFRETRVDTYFVSCFYFFFFRCSDPPTSITMFTTHKRRFEKRYEAFRTIPHPPPLTYEDYVRGTDFSTVASDDLVASATNCFRSAKGAIDWLLGAIVLECGDKPATALLEKRHDDDLFIPIRRQELLHLAKVCVHNLLFFHKLTSMGGVPQPSEKNTSVRLEFNAHKQYCTLSIV